MNDAELEIVAQQVRARREALALEKAQKESEKKRWWDKYYDQLAKAVPHQGGAHRPNTRGRRIIWTSRSPRG